MDPNWRRRRARARGRARAHTSTKYELPPTKSVEKENYQRPVKIKQLKQSARFRRQTPKHYKCSRPAILFRLPRTTNLDRHLDTHSRPELPHLPDRPLHNVPSHPYGNTQHDSAPAFEKLQESRCPLIEKAKAIPGATDFADKGGEFDTDATQIID